MLLKASLIGLLSTFALLAQSDWDEPFPPHKIAGNLYYVGSRGLSTFLITTSKGHILINPSFERTVPLIRASVEKLGFKFTDIKIILNNQAHNDHVEGAALLKELTGAQVFAMHGDAKVMEDGGKSQYMYKDYWKPVKVSRVLKDGDKITLGDATLTAVHTPGHTFGCTTFTMQVKEAGKTYNVVIIGGTSVNPGFQLVNDPNYPNMAADFAKGFRALKALPADIYLGAHGGYYDMEAKYKRLAAGAKENPFVDPKGYRAYVEDREKNYLQKLAEQKSKK